MKLSGISNFLEEISSLSHSIVFLYFFVLFVFLFLLVILWNSAFRRVYIFPFLLCLSLLLFSQQLKASSDKHFAFLHFFFWGWFW